MFYVTVIHRYLVTDHMDSLVMLVPSNRGPILLKFGDGGKWPESSRNFVEWCFRSVKTDIAQICKFYVLQKMFDYGTTIATLLQASL